MPRGALFSYVIILYPHKDVANLGQIPSPTHLLWTYPMVGTGLVEGTQEEPSPRTPLLSRTCLLPGKREIHLSLSDFKIILLFILEDMFWSSFEATFI